MRLFEQMVGRQLCGWRSGTALALPLKPLTMPQSDVPVLGLRVVDRGNLMAVIKAHCCIEGGVRRDPARSRANRPAGRVGALTLAVADLAKILVRPGDTLVG